ncbi:MULTISPECIES: hypothetical protein [Actinoalloteichus]|uniref:hypothetical protein n=1 Tax=Actinoalloteichus TaxID=65496 RepID=UPI0012F97030|nr:MULTISPECIES: hypothetical protein [Actinoalloteichus]
MASPDWNDPLCYLDASKLLDLLEENWEVFEPVIMDRGAWTGRRSELLAMRNRIGHLRRPHKDDIRRMEQVLRDLEVGAVRAVAAYNRNLDISKVNRKDPVVEAFSKDTLPEWKGILAHLERKYDAYVRLSYTRRPWVKLHEDKECLTGRSGFFWKLTIHRASRRYCPMTIWRECSSLTRQVVVHLLSSDPGNISFTFATVDSFELVGIGIADAAMSALNYSKPENFLTTNEGSISQYSNSDRETDPRLQIGSPWSLFDESMVPVSMFGA